MSQFLFIAPFLDNRQAFTQCRLPPSLPQRHNVTCLELVRETDGERDRDKAGPKFISPSRIIFPQILMGLAPVARRARSLAGASRSPFAVGGPPNIRMPPLRRRASERATKTTKKEEERERRTARYTTTPSTRRRPLFAILIGRYGGAKRGGAVAPCPKNDMKHLDGSEESCHFS